MINNEINTATHTLRCLKGKVPCVVIGRVKGGKIKIKVFGAWEGQLRNDVGRICYVDARRLVVIASIDT